MEYAIGDKVVNSGNLKMGNVIEINLTEDKVKLQYGDGLSEWVKPNQVANLLIDEQDYKGHFIQD